MVGWIIAGVFVLALLALAYLGTGKRRHSTSASTDLDIVSHHATGLRNDSSNTTFLL